MCTNKSKLNSVTEKRKLHQSDQSGTYTHRGCRRRLSKKPRAGIFKKRNVYCCCRSFSVVQMKAITYRRNRKRDDVSTALAVVQVNCSVVVVVKSRSNKQ